MCFVRDLCHIIQRDLHGSSRLSIEFTRDSIGKEYLIRVQHTTRSARLAPALSRHTLPYEI